MTNKKVFLIIALVLVLAVSISGIVISVVYNSVLKPTDFDSVPGLIIDDETAGFKHAYKDLNENEKKVYSVIMQSIYNQPDNIEIPELTDGDLLTVFQAISYDNPDLFNLGLNCKIYTEGYKTYFETDYSFVSYTQHN